MSIIFTVFLFVAAAWLGAMIGFAVNVYTGYALAGGVILLAINWMRGL